MLWMAVRLVVCFGLLLDSQDIHYLSCMSGGDSVRLHIGLRDVYYDYCERGGLRPESQTPGLLRDILGPLDAHRQADVLCIPALSLARRLPDGSRSIRTERVCFDFAIINASGADHWADTAQEGGLTADNYALEKAARNRVAERCEENGLSLACGARGPGWHRQGG